MIAKPFYKSKTVRFNALFLLIIIAGCFGFKDFKPDETVKQIAFVIPIIIQIVGNIILRFKTNSAIK